MSNLILIILLNVTMDNIASTTLKEYLFKILLLIMILSAVFKINAINSVLALVIFLYIFITLQFQHVLIMFALVLY